MNVCVRKATRADLPQVLQLLLQLDGGGGADAVLSIDEAARVFDKIAAYPNYAVYVAEGGEGRIIGTFALLIMDNLAHGGAPSAVVEDVCVDSGARGVGVGRAMMTVAMNVARGHGCYKLVLSSNVARTDAHAFYRALGFEQHGLSFRVDLR